MTAAPSAWKIQKALAAWNESRRLLTEEEAAQVNDDDILVVLGAVIDTVQGCGEAALSCKSRITDLELRIARFEAREEKFRQIAIDIMTALEEKTIEYPEFTITVSAGRKKVIITDSDILPTEYKTVEVISETKINKRLIASDLADGLVIDGVEMSNGGQILTIRTR